MHGQVGVFVLFISTCFCGVTCVLSVLFFLLYVLGLSFLFFHHFLLNFFVPLCVWRAWLEVAWYDIFILF